MYICLYMLSTPSVQRHPSLSLSNIKRLLQACHLLAAFFPPVPLPTNSVQLRPALELASGQQRPPHDLISSGERALLGRTRRGGRKREGRGRVAFAGEKMMTMMADVAQQKRRAEGFTSCEGGAGVRSGSCGAASSKRIKIGCDGGGGFSSAKEKKDKIGERVAALQQLVSPFGKTDTASVLHEATAYIKFLHEQLQVLSAPYIRSTPPGELQGSENYSLRSRGLCLVPVACTLGISHSNGADIWAPVNTNRT